MSMRGPVRFLLFAVLSWGTAYASDTAKRASPGSRHTKVATTPLRTIDTVSFSDYDWFAWLNPARCDADGNVFVVPMPEADPRDMKNPSAPMRFPKKPIDILRISADGKKSATFSPAAMPALADAEEITTTGMTVGPDGSPFALVWAPRGQGVGGLYIVSFDKTGRYRSRVEIDSEDMAVQGFEVFGSGEFLLQGVRPSGGPRVAVMSPSGGLLQDVFGVPEVESDASAVMPLKVLRHFARGGDGQIYFVSEGDRSIHAISPSGRSEPMFKLMPVPRNWRLVDLKAAGPRLAVVYFEEKPGRDTGRWWIAVYDVRFGERLAVYGPAAGVPVCYGSSGQRDQFTLLKDARYLVRLSPPL